jgi:hypothetical protein
MSHAWTVDFAAKIKQLVDIPVFTVKRINDPRMATGLLEMGRADFKGSTRPWLSPLRMPYWATWPPVIKLLSLAAVRSVQKRRRIWRCNNGM